NASPVLFMVKKNLIVKHKIDFIQNMQMYEDEVFTLEIFLNTKKMMYDQSKYYYRRYRKNSVMDARNQIENNMKSFNASTIVVNQLYNLLERYNENNKRK